MPAKRLPQILLLASVGSLLLLTACRDFELNPFTTIRNLPPKSTTGDWESSGSQEEPSGSINDLPVTPSATVNNNADLPPIQLVDQWTPTDQTMALTPSPKGAATVVADQRWQPIYFAFDQSFIGETERRKLEVLADFLKQQKQFHLLIEGHCDDRGSAEYNRSLGEKRALSARDFLRSLGIGSERMETLSYGEERPVVADHDDERSHALNRRAEFVIISPGP